MPIVPDQIISDFVPSVPCQNEIIMQLWLQKVRALFSPFRSDLLSTCIITLPLSYNLRPKHLQTTYIATPTAYYRHIHNNMVFNRKAVFGLVLAATLAPVAFGQIMVKTTKTAQELVDRLEPPPPTAFGSPGEVIARKLNPHTKQSVEVVIIGGATLDFGTPCSNPLVPLGSPFANVMGFTSGGCLQLTGPTGELGDFKFTAILPSAVVASSLAAYDTAVLNVASSAMVCNANNLSTQAKSDLVAFVDEGKKLIIYDSECGAVDYSWLPYEFTTNNPGAQGLPGTLTIAENNLLSDNDFTDPHYINAAYLGPFTDAVGDMNVMTTLHPNWCVDMSGTNANGFTGPVHTYAKTATGSNEGLYIYNGLDQDYQSLPSNPYVGAAWLRKIWVQELQQPFNPSNLPCGVTVVGVTLAPEFDEIEVGEANTVTATLKDLTAIPVSNVQVTFTIISGPTIGASGTCSANTDCSTDANGQVSFTYTGSNVPGIDVITATFTNGNGVMITSQPVQTTLVSTCVPSGSVGCQGDPHFLTWRGHHFDYHGECDLVLIKSDKFESGLGLDVHIRTTLRGDMSYISSAALRIGSDVLEVESQGVYYLNGVLSAALPAEFSEFAFSHTQPTDKQHVFEVYLGGRERIKLKTYKDFVSVLIEQGHSKHFSDSVGLMGDFKMGHMIARDGKAVMDDANAFGQEWQVLDTERSLFHTVRFPQHPQQLCTLPPPMKASQLRRRLLESSSVDQLAAEKACEHWGEGKDNCVFDVLTTGDLEMAVVGAY
jgi:hypothetical protein